MIPLSNFYFYICALVALGSALATVSVRSPLRAAMALLLHIITLAGLYLMLHAQMLAALQLLVYAGAVVVLFVFVIMLVGPSAVIEGTERGVIVRSMAVSAMLLVTVALAFSMANIKREAGAIKGCIESPSSDCATFGGVRAFSQELFGTSHGGVIRAGALVPFELISILLLVAIVGAIAVARGRSRAEIKALEDRRAELAQGDTKHTQPLSSSAADSGAT
ncbi:MAG: NADH-quinone oxidoreductase subunit J [Myxococcales bacterium]|nr:MAG: NADH-quinone oxidoreductase subunit J [Myxococcales bacterium]